MTKRKLKRFSFEIQNEFELLLWKSGFTDLSCKGQDVLSDYFQRTPRTIRRWLHTGKAPSWAIEKLNTRVVKLSDAWKGFSFEHDRLITPNGYSYTPEQLESLSASIDLVKSFYQR
jgi:hypothetical protein